MKSLDAVSLREVLSSTENIIKRKNALSGQNQAADVNTIIGNIKSDKCLEIHSAPGGERVIALSENYGQMLDGITRALKCRGNFESCAIFEGQLEKQPPDHSTEEAFIAAVTALQLATSNSDIRKLNSDLMEIGVITDSTVENLISEFQDPGLVMNSYGAVFSAATTLFSQRLISTNIGVQKAIQKKFQEVAAKNAKTTIANLGKKAEQEALEKMAQLLEKVKKTEALVNMIEKRQPKIQPINPSLQQKTMARISGFTRFVKSPEFAKAIVPILGKFGVAAGVVSGIAIGSAIDATPVIHDHMDGQKARGVTEHFERCSGSKSTFMVAEFTDGQSYHGLESNYYDAFTKRYKNELDNKNECLPYPVINLNKFERLGTTKSKDLIADMAADPLLCKYVSDLAEEFRIDDRHKLSHSLMRVNCPAPAPPVAPGTSFKVPVTFDDPRLKNLFGEKNYFEYTVNDKGESIPTRVSTAKKEGFSPAMVRAFPIYFKSVELGESLRPVHFANKKDRLKTPAFLRKCTKPSSLSKVVRCWDAYDEFDFESRHNVVDFGLSTKINTYKHMGYNKKFPVPMETRRKFQAFSTERGYATFFDGPNSKAKNDTLSNIQKQYADYSKQLMAATRGKLFQALTDVTACCAEENKYFSKDTSLIEMCKLHYRTHEKGVEVVDDIQPTKN